VKLEEQNIIHLSITAGELERIVSGTVGALEESSIHEQINDAVLRAKNFPPRKSVEMVMSVCEDILCQPLGKLTAADKDIFLGTLAHYTIMKRQIESQERMVKSKYQGAR